MTNAGEAFIGIGARALLEKLGDHQVVVASSMTEYYISTRLLYDSGNVCRRINI